MKAGLVICLLTGVLLLIGMTAWVRLAPSDPDRWHRMPEDVQAGDRGNGAVRLVENAGDRLAQLDAVIRGTPRTERLAGSLESHMLTYVTRSAGIGFPDYTTVRLRDGTLEIFGRARFGLSDMGVNAARIDGWLDALRQGG